MMSAMSRRDAVACVVGVVAALTFESLGRAGTADEIIAASKASTPPKPFLHLLSGLTKTPFITHPKLKDGWEVDTRCNGRRDPYCRYVAFCLGLQRSYHSLLLHDKKRPWAVTHLWAWEYQSTRSTDLAEAAVNSFGCTGSSKTVLSRQGRLLLVVESRYSQNSVVGNDRAYWEHVAALAKLLGQQATGPNVHIPFALPGCVLLTKVKVSSPKPGISRQLLDPSTPDNSLAAIVNAALDPLSLSGVLNRRGMMFYKKRELQRAAIAFELAACSELAFYNRACVAALQGDADTAIHYLWRLYNIFPPDDFTYCASTTESSRKLLDQSRKDKDFNGIRKNPTFRAFDRSCLATDDLPRWPSIW